MPFGKNSTTQRLASGARQPNWRDEALCLDLPPDWFDAGTIRHNMQTLLICDRCPVRRTCRDWMLDTPSSWAPAAIIAGGWVWGKEGRALHVHQDDLRDYGAILAAAKARSAARRAAARQARIQKRHGQGVSV